MHDDSLVDRQKDQKKEEKSLEASDRTTPNPSNYRAGLERDTDAIERHHDDDPVDVVRFCQRQPSRSLQEQQQTSVILDSFFVGFSMTIDVLDADLIDIIHPSILSICLIDYFPFNFDETSTVQQLKS